MEKKKHGCPYCGKSTSGTPTDKGFLWAVGKDCQTKLDQGELKDLASVTKKAPRQKPSYAKFKKKRQAQS